ncbi:GIY-YIG nuclease family protein [Aliiglaciecola sp. M165]|uniref:GIY-YIG nuclease family protein n=1 Tax=Aliiglaciecola sp. M165 TaxID=2593649 RepID=UPI00117CEDFA|nr:GIY-YIG nuclease family protein [Aliiglaciecola sp. M165]TRY28766.1 GIY-YIG nuclease family protein [Aliiglaciecola sp. M165]
MEESYVYIMSNKPKGTLYVGVTSRLIQRVYQHRTSQIRGFTKRYNLTQLVYYEVHQSLYEAISREKRLKKWNRAWKIRLIEKNNPDWEDLYENIV